MYNEKFIEVTSKNIHQDSVAASLVAINLTKFIAQIKEEDKWEKSDRNAITIFKSFLLGRKFSVRSIFLYCCI